MSNRPRTIAFVDLAPRPGGSIISLLLLAQGLAERRMNSGRMGVPPPGRPAPTDLASTQVDARRYAHQARFQSLNDPAPLYRLAVILNAANPAVARFRDSGFFAAGVFTVGSRQGLGDDYPALVERARQSGPIAHLRRLRAFLAAWQSAGALRRLLADTLPQARRLRDLLAPVQPDLVHLNDIVPVSRAGILAASWLRRPIVCHVRALDPLTWTDRRLTRRVDGFIFISQAVADQQRRAGATIRRSQVIPNAVNPNDFSPSWRGGALRQELGIAHDAFLVGSLGRLVTWKGHHIALTAFAAFARECPTAHIVIVGAPDVAEPDLEQHLRRLAAELHITDRVTFAGPRDDIPAVLAGLDVLCHCAVEPEPFGRVVIEGMAGRRPVIASAAGGVPEIIESGVNGLLVPPGDAASLAAALTDLWQHPLEAARLAAAGRERVETHFTLDQQVAGVEAMYDDIWREAERGQPGGTP